MKDCEEENPFIPLSSGKISSSNKNLEVFLMHREMASQTQPLLSPAAACLCPHVGTLMWRQSQQAGGRGEERPRRGHDRGREGKISCPFQPLAAAVVMVTRRGTEAAEDPIKRDQFKAQAVAAPPRQPREEGAGARDRCRALCLAGTITFISYSTSFVPWKGQSESLVLGHV